MDIPGNVLPTIVLDLAIETDDAALPMSVAEQFMDLACATLTRVGAARRTYAISVVLTDDTHMRQVNRTTRNQDKPTDVLSFPQRDQPLIPLPDDEAWAETRGIVVPFVTGPDGQEHLGDIIIALPTTHHQAEQSGHTFWWECCYLFVHGVLHLVGYDDATESGYRAMVAHQEGILSERGIRRVGG